MQQKIIKIIGALFLISFGTILDSQMIVQFVINPRADIENEQGLGIYNLFDHAIPYTFGALIITMILLVAYITLYYFNRNDKK